MSGGGLYTVYLLILFTANILGAIGGFGAGLISIPFLTQLFDTKMVVMTSTMTCMLNIFISLKNWNEIDWKELGKIVFGMCIGLPVGVYGLKIIDVGILKFILGFFMVMLGIYGFIKLQIPQIRDYKFSRCVLWLCLAVGGVVQGAISSGGCFVLLYAQQNLKEKKSFRATLALLWTVISVITVLQYHLIGAMTKESVDLFWVGAPAVLLGIYIGGKLCGRLSQNAFLYLINGIITVAGLLNCIVVLCP